MDQAFPVIGYRAIPDALELDPETLFEGCGQGLEIIAVHGEGVRMAVVADDLLSESGNISVFGSGPPSFDRTSDHYHGPVVCGVPVLHGLEDRYHLIVIITVVQRKNVPAVGGPLVLYPVSVVCRIDHAAHQLVINAGVVI